MLGAAAIRGAPIRGTLGGGVSACPREGGTKRLVARLGGAARTGGAKSPVLRLGGAATTGGAKRLGGVAKLGTRGVMRLGGKTLVKEAEAGLTTCKPVAEGEV